MIHDLKALLKERDKLLLKNPDLISYQMEIDRILSELDPDDPLAKVEKLNELLLHKFTYELLPAREYLRMLQEDLADVA
jgi:hypothetical protein